MHKMKKDIKDEITQKIVEKIELAQLTGADWTKPFRDLGGKPTNAKTNKAYKGLNALWLGMNGYARVATYNQWQDLGYQVQKGSTAIAITVPRIVKDKKTGDDTLIGFGGARVFPSSMVLSIESEEQYPDPIINAVDLTTRIAIADDYINRLNFEIRHSNEGRAYYTPSGDYVHMPVRQAFSDTKTSTASECYYSTLFHECAHMTGHKSRLDRLDSKNKRGYAFEELVAELSAAFLCNQLGVSSEPREDHVQYLASWLSALKNDTDYIFQAASMAQKAVDFMDNLQLDLEVAA